MSGKDSWSGRGRGSVGVGVDSFDFLGKRCDM